jgi:hypothetical protein
MLSPTNRLRANSLVETIIGGFLILTAIAILAALVDNSLRIKANTTQYSTAALIASNKLEELRAWGSKNGYRELETFDGWDAPSEMDSLYNVAISVTPRRLYSPSRSMEQPRGVDAKVLEDSVKRVVVSITWGEAEELSVVEYFGDLHVKDITLEAQGPSTVAPGSTADLSVIANDELGKPVEDLSFRWYVSPLSGLGSIQSYSRTGQDAVYINQCRGPGGRLIRIPGTCEVTVVTKYKRREYSDTIIITNG